MASWAIKDLNRFEIIMNLIEATVKKPSTSTPRS